MTCSDVDKSVRLWNYAEQSCVGVKIFDDSPTSCSIHRNGLELAVSFKSKILFFRITIGTLLAPRATADQAGERGFHSRNALRLSIFR